MHYAAAAACCARYGERSGFFSDQNPSGVQLGRTNLTWVLSQVALFPPGRQRQSCFLLFVQGPVFRFHFYRGLDPVTKGPSLFTFLAQFY